MNRRHFAQTVFWGSFGLCIAKAPFAATMAINYPFKTLPEAFAALRFSPGQEGNSFFVITADVHYGSKGTDGIMTTINEVNGMNLLPTFLCVNGDMICNGSPSFGVVPTSEGKKAAINELIAFKKDITQLDSKVQLILALGNHDTHPLEIDPEIFWEVFPGYPPYQSRNLSGVHIIVLNGHSTGYIDHRQMEWLLDDVNAIPKDQEVIIIIHQPSMSHRVNERGIPEAISEAFRTHRGRIWLIGGHEHLNEQKVFQLKKTKLIEHRITCGTANIWGGQEKPGYWAYCLRNGKVVGRIFKHRTQGYRIETEPDLKSAKKVPMPFDHLKNIRWKILVGNGDREFMVDCQAKDCLNYWAYIRNLTYRIPMKETGNRCTTIAILCNYSNMRNINGEGQYFISSDLTDWEQIKLEDAKYETLTFLIPDNFLQAENLYFKLIPEGEAHIGGFALL